MNKFRSICHNNISEVSGIFKLYYIESSPSIVYAPYVAPYKTIDIEIGKEYSVDVRISSSVDNQIIDFLVSDDNGYFRLVPEDSFYNLFYSEFEMRDRKIDIILNG